MNKFDISYYDYDFPEELIAQKPADRREDARLMVINRKTGAISHHIFSEITKFFEKSDCLVINNTKVMPARLKGTKKSTGAAIEVLLSSKSGIFWDAMMRNSRRIKPGDIIYFKNGLEAEIIAKHGKTVTVKFNKSGAEFYDILNKSGEIPLPPYIKADINDKVHKERYQTVYAKNEGAAAAPTAGLHFTGEILLQLKSMGVKIVEITLHTGLGTFEPVNEKDIRRHKIHTEHYEISKDAAEKINMSKRVVAVGTTSLRALETASNEQGVVMEKSGETGLFIYPGYRFKRVNALITNFHLPKTTLLALVYAFGGEELIKKAYEQAVKNKYRLFSYGDAMLIL